MISSTLFPGVVVDYQEFRNLSRSEEFSLRLSKVFSVDLRMIGPIAPRKFQTIRRVHPNCMPFLVATPVSLAA